MKKNKNVARRLVLFASLLLSLTICFAPQIEAQGTNKTTDSQGYSLVPFDFNSTTIDPNFKGHNIVDLFKAVDKLTNLKKEEFETTPEFKQRVLETQTKASKTIDYGALKMGDYVAFTLKSKNDANSTASQLSNVSFSYDADYQTLKITCYDNDSLNNRLVFLSIKGYGIFFEKKERQSNLPCVFVTGLSPEYAKEKLDDLAVCCVGQLFYYVKSELRNNHLLPSQATSSTTIPLANVEFWLYNKKTGEELVKFTSLDFESQTTRYLGDTTLDNPAKFYRMIKREQKRSSVEKRQQATENVSTISKSEVKTTPATSIEDTWQEVLAGRKQLKSQSWEKKQPALIVDSKTKNLADALQNASKGSVVQIAKGTRIKLDALATLANAIAIVGETGDPQDAIIVVGPNEYLVIQSSNVFFKGIAFEIDANSNEQPSESAVKVELLGDVLFIDCAFQGNRSVESSGVLINEGNAKFWNCVFKEFGGAGIVAQNEGSGTAAYCKFSDSNVGIKVLAKGTLDASACFFSNNGIGFDAQDNGGGSVKSNLFDANQNAWNVDYKSRGSLDFDKKTNIVDKK